MAPRDENQGVRNARPDWIDEVDARLIEPGQTSGPDGLVRRDRDLDVRKTVGDHVNEAVARLIEPEYQPSFDEIIPGGGRLFEEPRPDPDNPAQDALVRRGHARIIWSTVGVVVLGVFVFPGVVPWAVGWWQGADARATLERMALAVMWSSLGCPAYLLGGVALGCLVAPPGFLDTPASARWLKLIGTKNLVAARAVCAAFVLFALAVMVVVIAVVQALAAHPPGG